VLRYKCPDCDERFANPYRIEPHRHKVHGAEKAYECHVCGHKFCNKMSLKHHLKEKHSDSPPMRVCEHCGASVLYSRYKDHLQSRNCTGPKKIYQCTQCPVSYKTPLALR
jgi:DNA-directed RNA polymerase subunit RPC12/RpoP